MCLLCIESTSGLSADRLQMTVVFGETLWVSRKRLCRRIELQSHSKPCEHHETQANANEYAPAESL